MRHKTASTLKATFVEDPEIDFQTMVDKKNDMIPVVIADPYCREILQATKYVPKSAMEINSETKIPISTVYRRVQTLCDIGLLETTGNISGDGKKFFLYKSKIKEISIKYDGSLEVILTPNRSI